MGIHRIDVYRSPNIGIFLKASDKLLLSPKGLAESKVAKLSEYLRVEAVQTSVFSSRLLGPLIAMNSRGILLPTLAEEEEIAVLQKVASIPVETVDARYSCIGNLVACNDKGAIVSPLLPTGAVQRIHDVLDVPVEAIDVASYKQVGSMVVATNQGAVVHPRASDEEVARIAEALKVSVEPCTINGGVPYVASGLVANSREAVTGTVTSGPELAMLSRAFGV